MANLFLALLAGMLSVLSPCVLPLLPLVLGTAASRNRSGPAMLALGMALSFVTIGLFVALAGYSIGLDQGFFRGLAAWLLVGVGLVLAFPPLQCRVAAAAGPVSGWVDSRFGGTRSGGHAGQFGTGVLLGAVWSPCVGPTLGAASLLAAQGENVGRVTLTMLFFGLGAALPLMALGMASRELLLRWRSAMLHTGQAIKIAMGIVLITSGVLILTQLDRRVEANLVDASPAWLTNLTTRF